MRQFYRIPLRYSPDACAAIRGSPEYPSIIGDVCFYQTENGVLVVAYVDGLPENDNPYSPNIYGMHIHESGPCTGNEENPFADVGAHYNPYNCPHPAHAGDLPPLFGNQGLAFMSILTDRFTVNEVLNRSVIIHANPDDFTTQPSGNPGKMIACGQILRS